MTSVALWATVQSDVRNFFSFLLVSLYLIPVGIFLIVTGRLDPGMSFLQVCEQMMRRFFHRVRQGTLTDIQPDTGNCFLAEVDMQFVSDKEGASSLLVLEDDHPLPEPHASHDRVREVGDGSYSHWATKIYFSATDNTDPRTNGRTYRFKDELA